MTAPNQQTRVTPPAGPSIIADYRPHTGKPDEMMDAQGRLRPGWADLMSSFDRLGAEELARRFERADQYMRDAGVFYRKYEGGAGKDRDWPLAHVPLLIHEQEWSLITSGLTQRAELLEHIVSDIYSANTLVQQGLLPAELIAHNPEFLRPLVGVIPESGHYLHFCAFELGRGLDGKWRVLGDWTQAPSGAGFALENRVATSRALNDIHADMNVHRLAGFFRGFRDALFDQTVKSGGQVGILTPGQLNETYFEHAYIARYLGLMLLEGDDLIVENGKVMVRTISGPQPLSVLWRRMDASFIDPLELRYESRIGTAGMVDALRQRSISMINAPGAGILETRAFSSLMPRLARTLLGEDLHLSDVPTWWCGQAGEKQYVLEHFDELMIGPSLSTEMTFDDLRGTALGSSVSPAQREMLLAHIEQNGAAYVGQELVQLSTTPVYFDGRLEPRPFTLRVFAARIGVSWAIMPGGFARVASAQDGIDAASIAMQRGGQAADVWVLSSSAVEPISLLPQNGENLVRNASGSLPSRAADNLIWLGRYAERCEATLRILRAYHIRLAELGRSDLPLLTHCAQFLTSIDIDVESAMPQGLLASLDSAVHSAGQIRDRFSPDGWLALTDLQKTAKRFAAGLHSGDDATRAMTVLLRKLAGFSGLVHENMYRFAGWRFLELGRRLERAMQIASVTGHLTANDAPEGSLELLLEIGDSVMTHRRRYSVSAGTQSVTDLLVLDPLNPRSVLFQISQLRSQIETLPGGIEQGQLSSAAKMALNLETLLRTSEPGDLPPERLHELSDELGMLANLVATAYFV